ncbi:hypothetical protein CMEL01_13416 [Colletotrichum melonis]|uniref:Uncharacterized protein n=1 Tax=Colletotrichum melonis TaxID=1209925 RepID=A0AAI9XUD4_9PEZI|nr:hypothetical protein CMEL01_13416 [Colletotrichum melonis]
MTTVTKPLAIRSTSSSIARKPSGLPLGSANSSKRNPRQASWRPRHSHSRPRQPKRSISSGYLSCYNTQFSEDVQCSYGCPLSIATTPSTIFDDGVSPEDDGRSTAQRANVNNKTENSILSEARASTENDPEECHNDHPAVGSQLPITLSGHHEHSQQKSLSSNPCPAPISAEDFNWSSIPAVDEFKNDPAHEYWEWNSVTEQWCHTDEEGLTLSCPAMLD